MFVFRMHANLREVFDTTGAVLYPGRWHSAGTRVVYAAEHGSLAVLETLIHAGGRKMPPRALTRIEILDEVSVEISGWLDTPYSQAFGDLWVREKRSAVLRVPSIAVNKMESNFLFNPRHPAFARIRHNPPQAFVFDPRFFAI
jgi:RES domain-containing protein